MNEELADSIDSFQKIINLFQTNKEMILYYFFYNECSFISLKQRHLTIAIKSKVPKDFPNNALILLEKWTGQKWQISITKNNDSISLEQAHKKSLEQKDQLIINHSLVQKTLKLFPGSKILKISAPHKEN